MRQPGPRPSQPAPAPLQNPLSNAPSANSDHNGLDEHQAVPQLDFRMPLPSIPTVAAAGPGANVQHVTYAPVAVPEVKPDAVLLPEFPEAAAGSGPDLGKLAHELRTPLGAIVALAEVMRDEQFGALGNARYKGYANDIHQSAHHALAVLTAMLDAGPGPNGHPDPRGRMTFERVELNALARGCVSGLQPVAAKAKIHLRTALNAHPLYLTADRRSLKQIILNLLANALRFTPHGGTITVATSVKPGDALFKDGYFQLDVRDTGAGMTKVQVADVLHRSIDALPGRPVSSEQGHGNEQGVGLPLAKALAEAHSGLIMIASEPGTGTTVSLALPTGISGASPAA
jgi:signal transduction histidine kinase